METYQEFLRFALISYTTEIMINFSIILFTFSNTFINPNSKFIILYSIYSIQLIFTFLFTLTFSFIIFKLWYKLDANKKIGYTFYILSNLFIILYLSMLLNK